MTISHVASTGVTTAVNEGPVVDIFVPANGTGYMAFMAIASYEEAKDASVVTGWTLLGTSTGNDSTTHAAPTDDNHGTKLSVWYREFDNSEPTAVSGFYSVSSASTWNTAQGCMQLYDKTSGNTWATPIIVSGSDNSHVSGGSSTLGTWASGVDTGDWVIWFFSSDTDNAITITAGTVSQTGVTFGTPVYRSRRGSTGGVDCAVYGFDVPITTASASTNAPTVGFTQTGGNANCGAAIAVRLREVSANPPQTVNLSLVTDTSTGQTFTGAKRATTALISGTQTAQAINEQKTKSVALTSVTNTAQVITYSRRQTVNQVTINQTAQPIVATFTGKVNLVTETDSAFTHGKRKSKTLSLVVSDHFILGLAAQHQKTIALTSDEAIAQPLNEVKFLDIEVVLEDNVAPPLTIGRRKEIAQVSEIDRAITLGTTFRLLMVSETDSVPSTTRLKRRSLALVTETDAEFAIQPFHSDAVAQVLETDTANPQHIIYSRLVHQVSETDTAFAVHQFLKRDLSLVSETDSVGDLIDFIKSKQLVLVVGNDIARAIGPKIQHPPSSIILDVRIPDPTQLTVFIEDDEVSSGLVVLVSQRF